MIFVFLLINGVLLTSLCAIRVANVPEVCVKKKKLKSRLSSQTLSEKFAGNQVSKNRLLGRVEIWVVFPPQSCMLAGGLTDDGVGVAVFIWGVWWHSDLEVLY